MDRVAENGPRLGRMIIERLSDHPHVGDIRGIGFMWGVELVADRQTRRPFARRDQVTERLYRRLYDDRVLLYKATGLAGSDGDAMVVGPPFVVSEPEMERIADSLARAVAAELGS